MWLQEGEGHLLFQEGAHAVKVLIWWASASVVAIYGIYTVSCHKHHDLLSPRLFYLISKWYHLLVFPVCMLIPLDKSWCWQNTLWNFDSFILCILYSTVNCHLLIMIRVMPKKRSTMVLTGHVGVIAFPLWTGRPAGQQWKLIRTENCQCYIVHHQMGGLIQYYCALQVQNGYSRMHVPVVCPEP